MSLIRKLIVLAILINSMMIVFPTNTAQAQSSVRVSDTKLEFRGLVGETLQRSFTLLVDGDALTNLQVIVPDLVDPDSGDVIISDNVSVNPSLLDTASGRKLFKVTLQGTSGPGHFTGDLKIRYDGLPQGQEISITLDVLITTLPAVDADVSSKNLTLYAQPAFLDVPFGRPSTGDNAPLLGEIALSVVQDAAEPASILGAKILALQRADGRTLPDQAVRVETQFPIELKGKDGATLRVTARGQNLPAGEYNGTLLINVFNQPNAVKIPVKVDVKDGPILAFILLAAGPLVGILFFYWNKNGKALFDAQNKVKRLQARIRSGRGLTIEDQDNARRKLQQVIGALLAREDTNQVQAGLQEVESLIQQAQANAETYLTKVQAQKGKIEALEYGKTVKEGMLQELDQMQKKIEGGEMPNWAVVDTKMKDLEGRTGEVEAVIEQYKSLDAEMQQNLAPRLEEARDLTELKMVVQKELAREVGRPGAAEEEIEEPAISREWHWFSVSLQWQRLGVAAVVYLFTLFVGWITLYASSPTFGANPQDYITLFLWGVASNMVGGQTVDLKSILTQQEVSLPGPNVDKQTAESS